VEEKLKKKTVLSHQKDASAGILGGGGFFGAWTDGGSRQISLERCKAPERGDRLSEIGARFPGISRGGERKFSSKEEVPGRKVPNTGGGEERDSRKGGVPKEKKRVWKKPLLSPAEERALEYLSRPNPGGGGSSLG